MLPQHVVFLVWSQDMQCPLFLGARDSVVPVSTSCVVGVSRLFDSAASAHEIVLIVLFVNAECGETK